MQVLPGVCHQRSCSLQVIQLQLNEAGNELQCRPLQLQDQHVFRCYCAIDKC